MAVEVEVLESTYDDDRDDADVEVDRKQSLAVLVVAERTLAETESKLIALETIEGR